MSLRPGSLSVFRPQSLDPQAAADCPAEVAVVAAVKMPQATTIQSATCRIEANRIRSDYGLKALTEWFRRLPGHEHAQRLMEELRAGERVDLH